MKKFFVMAVVALAGLMATACSTDDAVSDAENYATVSFTVAAPEMATRTLGDGMTARNLSWGVYDADGNYLPKLFLILLNTNLIILIYVLGFITSLIKGGVK